MTEMDGELDRAVDQYDNDLELICEVIDDMPAGEWRTADIAEVILKKLAEAGRLVLSPAEAGRLALLPVAARVRDSNRCACPIGLCYGPSSMCLSGQECGAVLDREVKK